MRRYRVLLILIFSSIVTFFSNPVHGDELSSHFSDDSRVALGAYRGMVEEHVNGVRRALRIIASMPQAKAGSWEECKPLLTRLSEDLPTDATAWLVFPDGSYFATEAAGMADENLRDRSYFPVLMSGREVFGDLVISKSTGHRSLIIAVPVVSGDKTIGAFGVSLRVRLLSELVNEHMPLPPTAYFYALEGDTRIVMHRKAERMFQTPSDVGDEALGEEFKRVLHNDSGVFEYTLHGKKMEAIFEKSPSLGWFFFIAKEK